MQPLKLLVVEDHIPSLELMTEVFVSLKAEVRPISESEKAVAMVNQEKFDGIFLDLEMPNLNGFDLARLVRKSSWNKSTPIIIVTGRDDRQTMQDAFAIGATFFLQKPVDRQKLSALFRTVSWRDAGEQAQVYPRTDPDRGRLHRGLSNRARDQLEPQPRGNAGRSGWLEAQRRCPIVIQTASLWSGH